MLIHQHPILQLLNRRILQHHCDAIATILCTTRNKFITKFNLSFTNTSKCIKYLLYKYSWMLFFVLVN